MIFKINEPIVASLTKRELQILELIINDNSNLTIANLLEISVHTVEKHRRNLMLKLDCQSSLGLMHWSINNGLVTVTK